MFNIRRLRFSDYRNINQSFKVFFVIDVYWETFPPGNAHGSNLVLTNLTN